MDHRSSNPPTDYAEEPKFLQVFQARVGHGGVGEMKTLESLKFLKLLHARVAYLSARKVDKRQARQLFEQFEVL